MKLKFTILALLATLTISTFAQKKPTKAELDASKIIQYGNTVIELGNSYTQTLKNYESVLKSAENNLESVTKNPNLSPHFVNCNVISVKASQQTAYNTASKTVQAFPEKSDIDKFVNQGEKDIKSIGVWCTALSEYASKKEYKEDQDLVKYITIRDSLNFHIAQAYTSWMSASKQASIAGNRAELILLEGSRIASFIIPMKKDLNSLKDVFNMINTETPNIDAIKTVLAELKISIDKNKDTSTKDISKLSDIYYKEVYQTFYRKCSSAVESLNTVTSRLQEKEIDVNNINSWFGSASSDYNSAIEEYNKFVSQ